MIGVSPQDLAHNPDMVLLPTYALCMRKGVYVPQQHDPVAESLIHSIEKSLDSANKKALRETTTELAEGSLYSVALLDSVSAMVDRADDDSIARDGEDAGVGLRPGRKQKGTNRRKKTVVSKAVAGTTLSSWQEAARNSLVAENVAEVASGTGQRKKDRRRGGRGGGGSGGGGGRIGDRQRTHKKRASYTVPAAKKPSCACRTREERPGHNRHVMFARTTYDTCRNSGARQPWSYTIEKFYSLDAPTVQHLHPRHIIEEWALSSPAGSAVVLRFLSVLDLLLCDFEEARSGRWGTEPSRGWNYAYQWQPYPLAEVAHLRTTNGKEKEEEEERTHSIYTTLISRIEETEALLLVPEGEIPLAVRRAVVLLQDQHMLLVAFMERVRRYDDAFLMKVEARFDVAIQRGGVGTPETTTTTASEDAVMTTQNLLRVNTGLRTEKASVLGDETLRVVHATGTSGASTRKASNAAARKAADTLWKTALDDSPVVSSEQHPSQRISAIFTHDIHPGLSYYDVYRPDWKKVFHEGELPNLIDVLNKCDVWGCFRISEAPCFAHDILDLMNLFQKAMPLPMKHRVMYNIAASMVLQHPRIKDCFLRMIFAMLGGYYPHSKIITLFPVRKELYRWLSFETPSTNEIANWINGHYDAFIRRRRASAPGAVSAGAAGSCSKFAALPGVSSVQHTTLSTILLQEYIVHAISFCPSIHHHLSTYYSYDSMQRQIVDFTDRVRLIENDIFSAAHACRPNFRSRPMERIRAIVEHSRTPGSSVWFSSMLPDEIEAAAAPTLRFKCNFASRFQGYTVVGAPNLSLLAENTRQLYAQYQSAISDGHNGDFLFQHSTLTIIERVLGNGNSQLLCFNFRPMETRYEHEVYRHCVWLMAKNAGLPHLKRAELMLTKEHRAFIQAIIDGLDYVEDVDCMWMQLVFRLDPIPFRCLYRAQKLFVTESYRPEPKTVLTAMVTCFPVEFHFVRYFYEYLYHRRSVRVYTLPLDIAERQYRTLLAQCKYTHPYTVASTGKLPANRDLFYYCPNHQILCTQISSAGPAPPKNDLSAHHSEVLAEHNNTCEPHPNFVRPCTTEYAHAYYVPLHKRPYCRAESGSRASRLQGYMKERLDSSRTRKLLKLTNRLAECGYELADVADSEEVLIDMIDSTSDDEDELLLLLDEEKEMHEAEALGRAKNGMPATTARVRAQGGITIHVPPSGQANKDPLLKFVEWKIRQERHWCQEQREGGALSNSEASFLAEKTLIDAESEKAQRGRATADDVLFEHVMSTEKRAKKTAPGIFGARPKLFLSYLKPVRDDGVGTGTTTRAPAVFWQVDVEKLREDVLSLGEDPNEEEWNSLLEERTDGWWKRWQSMYEEEEEEEDGDDTDREEEEGKRRRRRQQRSLGDDDDDDDREEEEAEPYTETPDLLRLFHCFHWGYVDFSMNDEVSALLAVLRGETPPLIPRYRARVCMTRKSTPMDDTRVSLYKEEEVVVRHGQDNAILPVESTEEYKKVPPGEFWARIRQEILSRKNDRRPVKEDFFDCSVKPLEPVHLLGKVLLFATGDAYVLCPRCGSPFLYSIHCRFLGELMCSACAEQEKRQKSLYLRDNLRFICMGCSDPEIATAASVLKRYRSCEVFKRRVYDDEQYLVQPDRSRDVEHACSVFSYHNHAPPPADNPCYGCEVPVYFCQKHFGMWQDPLAETCAELRLKSGVRDVLRGNKRIVEGRARGVGVLKGCSNPRDDFVSMLESNSKTTGKQKAKTPETQRAEDRYRNYVSHVQEKIVLPS